MQYEIKLPKDGLAIETAGSAAASYRRSHDILGGDEDLLGGPASEDERKGDVSLFLSACAGVDSDPSGPPLVSDGVIRRWVGICCGRSGQNPASGGPEDRLALEDDDGSNVLLRALLGLAASSAASDRGDGGAGRPPAALTRDEAAAVVGQSWLEGGETWRTAGSAVVAAGGRPNDDDGGGDNALRSDVVRAACASLRADVEACPPSDRAVLELACQAWARRAARLLGMADPEAPLGLEELGISRRKLVS